MLKESSAKSKSVMNKNKNVMNNNIFRETLEITFEEKQINVQRQTSRIKICILRSLCVYNFTC